MGTYSDINPTPLDGNGWVQTFHDGFNGAYLDRAAWPILQWGPGRNGAFTYSPNNVIAYGGEVVVANIADGSNGWTSGAFQQGWNGQLYGRWEVRAKYDYGQGATAAILLWPTDGSDSYEIDLNESRGADKSLNNVSIHGPDDFVSMPFIYDATQWHTYAVDVVPGRITVYLDGEVLYETYERVPNIPMSMGFLGYVATAEQDWFGGAPNASTPANVNLHIDWVRAYTLADMYPGDLPPALYGTSAADLHPTSNSYTGQWTAGLVTDAEGNREFALTGMRAVLGTNYAATWNSAEWNSQVTLVTDAPASWSPAYASNLLFANFADVELDFRTAGSKALNLVAEGAQHGNIALGGGDNNLTWVAHSDTIVGAAGTNNVMTMVTGEGDDTVTLTAPALSQLDEPFGWGSAWHGDYDGHASIARVRTGAGDDTIVIEATQAIIDAGSGDDRVVWHAPSSRFTVSVAADGATLVTDHQGVLGTAVLYGVEHLAFSDVTLDAPSSAANPNPFDITPIGTTPSVEVPPTDPTPTDPTPTEPPPASAEPDWYAIGAAMTNYHNATGQWWNGDFDSLLAWDAANSGGGGSTPEPTPTEPPPARAEPDWYAIGAAMTNYHNATGQWWNGDFDSLLAWDAANSGGGGSTPEPTPAEPPPAPAEPDWYAIGAAMTNYHNATGQWWNGDFDSLLAWDAANSGVTTTAGATPALTADWSL